MANEKLGSFVSVSWLCGRAGVTRQRVSQLIGEGKLAATFASGRWWIREDVARLWLDSRKGTGDGVDSADLDLDGEAA